MVLVNTLTIEAINTALIALQRGKDIVVGGEKGTTINNITISNSGSGGSSGSSLDFSPQIDALDKRVGLLEKAEELLRIENEKQSERIAVLEGLGIENVQFDDTSRTLSIELVNGETFETDITSETLSMRLEGNELVIKFGESEQRLPLPAGTQADWEQTDPDAPDYIKNKIPIWIEDGPASDNMAPVDSVTAGEMRPVTSNAVAQEGYLTSADITDQVTVNNMHSVTSNAVARAINPSSTTIIESTNKRTVSVTAGKTDWWSMAGYPAPSVPSGKRLIRTFPRCSNNGVGVAFASIYSTTQDIDIPSVITVSDSTSSVQVWLCIEVADL